MSSPPGKSRGGTPEGVRALQGARRSASCGGYGLRLTAFRFPFLSWLAEHDRDGSRPPPPAPSDEDRALKFVVGTGFGITRARMRRENEIAYFTLPCRGGGAPR